MTRQGTRIAALVVGCAVVAGGAYVATDALSSSAPAAPAASAAASQQPAATSSAQPAGSTPVGESAQAAALSAAITDAAPGGATAGTPAQRAVRISRALRRLRLLGGEHGEFTFRTKQGTRTLAFERGTIVSVAGSDVTVRAADGTTWTWLLTSTSVVRDDGSRTTSSALSAGEPVFVGGPAIGTARDARLIVIRQSSTSAKPPTSAPATSAPAAAS